MSQPGGTATATVRLQRIVVALDASPHSLAALDAAVALAAALDAEILALFVEDANLLRYTQLPIAWAVSSFSGGRVAVRADDVLRDMRARARTAADAVARHAANRRLRWSFTTLRGSPAELLLSAAASADLVSLGRAGWPGPAAPILGSTARRLAAEAGASTLVIAGGQRLSGPVLLLLPAGPEGERALALAMVLAGRLACPLHGLVFAAEPEAGAAAAQAMAERLDAAGLTASTAAVSSDTEALAAVAAARPGLLVAPAGLSLLAGEGLVALLDRAGCPLLIAR